MLNSAQLTESVNAIMSSAEYELSDEMKDKLLKWTVEYFMAQQKSRVGESIEVMPEEGIAPYEVGDVCAIVSAMMAQMLEDSIDESKPIDKIVGRYTRSRSNLKELIISFT